MKIPIMRGIMDRRILANFHVDPDVLSQLGRIIPKAANGGCSQAASVCPLRFGQ